MDEYKNERQHDDSLGKRSKSLCKDDSVTDLFPQGMGARQVNFCSLILACRL